MAQIKILTFNTGLARLHLGPASFDLVPRVASRVERIIEKLTASPADIVCLQEVFESTHEALIRRTLADSYPYQYFSPTPKFLFGKGLSILSKTPFEITDTIDFPGVGCDRIAKKGAVVGTFTDGLLQGLTIVNTHFPYGGYGQRSLTSRRSIQVRQKCLEILNKRLAPSTQKIVLAGDFNFGENISPENYTSALASGYQDLTAGIATWDPDNTLNTLFKISSPKSLDHILISEALSGSVVSTEASLALTDLVQSDDVPFHLSDHYGLLVALELRTDG